jgi:CarD family transcriptional regulator
MIHTFYHLIFGGVIMYNVGDKIVYPMHGAGVIESIEEREILGKKQDYYILKMPARDMKVMIPIDNASLAGIREVVASDVYEQVLSVFKQHQSLQDTTTNWNKRYRENMIKIRGGNIFEVADVVKTLMIREKEKGLSTGEKKMLMSAKQILISELVLAKNIQHDEIEDTLNSVLNTQ